MGLKRWGVNVRVYWCSSRNVPSRDPNCGGEGEGKLIRVAEPGDIRPAFQGDIELINEGLTNEFGSPSLLSELGIGDYPTYLNKAPHFDDMKEVIVGGSIVGRLYFDPKYLMWRWRLSKVSAELAASEGLVPVFRLRGPLRPLQVLGEGSGREGDQAVVIDNNGDVVGLAVVRRGHYRIQTIFRSASTYPIRLKASLSDYLKINDELFRSRVSKAFKRVAIMAEKTGLLPLVSFSGGKDSLVALDISVKAGLEPSILFNNTGIEFPSTISNVDEVSRTYGLELIEASAGDLFWEGVKSFGPPAKDYRWCCKVVKMAPIAKVYKELFREGLLSIIGQRAYESINRSRSGAVWRNKWLPSALNVAPLQEWDQLTVWTYIMINKLPVNDLYFKGFDRLGCYLCPAGNVAEYYMVMKHYPELWERWINILEEWRKKLGLSDYWVKYHLWRWLSPSAEGRRKVESWLGIKEPGDWREEYVRRSGISVELIKSVDNEVELRVKSSLGVDGLKSQWRVLGTSIHECGDKVTIYSKDSAIEVDGESIRASGSNALEKAFTALKLMVRWDKCVGCRNCETWCPEGAIRVINGKPIVKPSSCTGCQICVEVCPISEVFTEKLLVSQALNNHSPKRRRAWVSLNLYRNAREIRKYEVRPDYSGLKEFFRE